MASVDGVNFTDFSADEIKVKSEDGNIQNGVSTVHYLFLNNLPLYYKIYVHNRTGSALSANAGDNILSYYGVKN